MSTALADDGARSTISFRQQNILLQPPTLNDCKTAAVGPDVAARAASEPGVRPRTRGAVHRARLCERLDAIPRGGTALIVAPPGAGKSVLLDQWMTTRPELTMCPLTLTGGRDGGTTLTAALADAFDRTTVRVEPPPQVAMASAGGARVSADLLGDVLRALRSHSGEVVIVFDDAHVLDGPEFAAQLGELAAGLPPQARLLISSRWDLVLPSRSLRLSGRLVELRDAELAFTTDEAAQLLDSVSGRSLESQHVAALVERTDGWAAGLQLAAISLQRADDPGVFVAEFAGTDHLVVEYLTAEVLDTVDESTRRFLSCTSVLPWLSADLCDAVTGASNGRQQLRELAGRSLFLVPLDRRGERFRYHQLFVDLLRYQFAEQHERAEQHRVRIAAAEWLLQRGHVDEAVEQLLAADKSDRVLAVVTDHGRDFLERSEAAILETWLQRASSGQPETTPATAINLLAAQIASQHYVEAAETHRTLVRRPDLTPGDRIVANALYSCLCLDELPPWDTIELTNAVLAELPRVDPEDLPDILGIDGWTTAEALAGCMQAYAHLRAGRVTTAAQQLRWVAGLRGMQYVVWRIHTQSAMALVSAWTGRLGDAEQLARRTLDIADSAGVGHHTCTTAAHLALAAVALERGRPAQASSHLVESDRRTRRDRGRFFTDLHTFLDVRQLSLTEGPRAGIQRLRSGLDLSTSCSLIVDAATALEGRLLLELGSIELLQPLLVRAATTPVTAPVRVDLALGLADVAQAATELERWDADDSQPIQAVERHVARCAVLLAAGDEGGARVELLAAAEVAEVEGLRRAFLERPTVLCLAKRTHHAARQTFLSSLNDARRPAGTRAAGQAQLIDPLTERELSVLEYLPTRMTNGDIAEALFVSVNTVKTHVRSIYRKLDVPGRDSAVERARDLGLI